MDKYPMNWKYAGKAEVNMKEKKSLNIKVIILICVLILFIVLGSLGFIYRHYIIDKFTNPYFVLTTEETEIEVNSEFDYSIYVGDNSWPTRYEVIYPDSSQVDTSKLGEYNLEFILKTEATENVSNLLVKVVDTTPPVLELTAEEISLTKGEETMEFNPETYVKSMTDNYDKRDNLTLNYSNILDWSGSEVWVDYTLADTSGNNSKAKLKVLVLDEEKDFGTVVVEYVNTEGTPIIEDGVVFKAKIGTPYKTEQKDIPGYTFKELGKNSAPKEGEIERGELKVVYVYEKVEEEKKEEVPKVEESKPKEDNPSTEGESTSASQDSQNVQNSQESSSSTEQSSSSSTSAAPRGHYIDVDNITVKKGTSLDQFISILQSSIKSDEEVQVLFGAVSQESLNTPGKYTITCQSANVTKDVIVTVTN